jgi:hypothetical protein
MKRAQVARSGMNPRHWRSILTHHGIIIEDVLQDNERLDPIQLFSGFTPETYPATYMARFRGLGSELKIIQLALGLYHMLDYECSSKTTPRNAAT